MSLPPSAVYQSPLTGIAYNQLETCLYSNSETSPGQAVVTPAALAILPFDANPAGAVGIFQQMGNSCGLTINRVVPADVVNTRQGALLNSGTLPVLVSGSVLIVTSTAPQGAADGPILIRRQEVATNFANAVNVGGGFIPADAPAGTLFSISFSTILKPGQSLFCQNVAISTATVSASLQAVRAQVVYGTLNSVSIPVVGP